jgi:hypothetical protein
MMASAVAICAALLMSIGSIGARAQELDSNAILFRYAGHTLRDSKWGRIAEFQRALNGALARCGLDTIDADGIMGPATRSAIAVEEHHLGRASTSAERRRVIAHALVPKARAADRLGRDVVYFVDGIGESNLSKEEREAWRSRTGRRASECGLSDERTYYPPFLNAQAIERAR